MRCNCCSSLSSLTEFAVGLTDEGCWASAGGASEINPASASAAKISRRRATSVVMPLPPFLSSLHLSPPQRGEVDRASGRVRGLTHVQQSAPHPAPLPVDGEREGI